jgi:hypothetical protein
LTQLHNRKRSDQPRSDRRDSECTSIKYIPLCPNDINI